MATVWVLETDTKGTGAHMVPLEDTLADPARGPRRGPGRRPPERAPTQPEGEARQPPSFKVVDVLSRQVLAEDASTRDAVDLLEGIRSVVDVSIYVRDPEHRGWRPLTTGEKQVLWRLRGRRPASPAL